MAEGKQCICCKIFKRIDEFYKNPSNKDKVNTHCIPCSKKRDKAGRDRRKKEKQDDSAVGWNGDSEIFC